MVKIVVDDRELRSSVVKMLYEKGVEIDVKRLEVGDYIISSDCAIERKDAGDFESSICDGRLFVQCGNLSNIYARPLVALIGTSPGRVNPSSVRGAVRSIGRSYRIPVLLFDSDSDFVDWLVKAAEKEQSLGGSLPRINVEKKADTIQDKQLRVIGALPGVGATHARALLAQFGSIQNLVLATEEQLKEVKGIGEKRAKDIKELLESNQTIRSPNTEVPRFE